MNATGSTTYFIKTDEDPHGPLTAEQVRLRIMEKGLVASDLLRRDDGEEWLPIGSLPEFQEAVEASARPAKERKPYLMVVLSLLLVALPFELEPLKPEFMLGSWIAGIVLAHLVVGRSKLLQNGFGFRLTARAILTIGYFMLFIGINDNFGRHPPQERGYRTKTIYYGKQVLTYLKIYASDHNGKYPDATLPDARTSNEVFRQMFKEGVADNEMVFGDGISPFKADGNIGTKPDFSEAVKAGENHWAMTKGLTEDDKEKIPLIFENPSEATWPPKWNADLAMQAKPGRTWSKGRVIVGFHDGSVELLPLESDHGKSVGLKPRADGTPIFPILPGRKLEVLNVAK